LGRDRRSNGRIEHFAIVVSDLKRGSGGNAKKKEILEGRREASRKPCKGIDKGIGSPKEERGGYVETSKTSVAVPEERP